jgi:hypothetical protein
MQRVIAISFSILLGAAALAAQAVDQYRPQKFDPQASQYSPKVTVEILKPAGCPVSMRAQQSSGWNMVKVETGQPREPLSFQSIRLTLSDGRTGQVTGARVKVHGLTDRGRFLPASGKEGPSEITRMVNVTFDGGGMNEVAADLVLRGFTSIKSIDLESLTYADGSVWKAEELVCRAFPDPLMLVGAR